MRSKSSPLMFPLSGIKIVEFEGIGPGPLAGFMLMQMGADVTVVGRQVRAHCLMSSLRRTGRSCRAANDASH